MSSSHQACETVMGATRVMASEWLQPPAGHPPLHFPQLPRDRRGPREEASPAFLVSLQSLIQQEQTALGPPLPALHPCAGHRMQPGCQPSFPQRCCEDGECSSSNASGRKDHSAFAFPHTIWQGQGFSEPFCPSLVLEQKHNVLHMAAKGWPLQELGGLQITLFLPPTHFYRFGRGTHSVGLYGVLVCRKRKKTAPLGRMVLAHARPGS